MEREEEGIAEMIKKGIVEKGYSIDEDIKTENSIHIMFAGKGESYMLNLLRLE